MRIATECLLHTIALEPARWTPRRVSRPLTEILPQIAGAGFRAIEVFEPHLDDPAGKAAIKAKWHEHHLTPVILSSYLNLGPEGVKEGELESSLSALEETIRFFGFQKVRLFPGPKIAPGDKKAVALFTRRLARAAERLDKIPVLLETHDHSIADDPQKIVDIVRTIGAPHMGLLFQPTVFDQEAVMRQAEIQYPFIRHVHLQNRHPDLSFARLEEGVIRWKLLLARMPDSAGLTLEFVPRGICPEDRFDLSAVIDEAKKEAAFAKHALSAGTASG